MTSHEGRAEGRAARVRRAGWTWMMSLGVHGLLAFGITALALSTMRQREAEDRARMARAAEPIPIDLPLASDGDAIRRAVIDHIGEEPIVAGGATVSRIDTGRGGRGGDLRSRRATHLSDRDENLHLTPDPVSHLDRDQIQRLRVSQARASWEDRRMTTHPMELTFLASGTGDVQQRRTLATVNPSRGAMRSLDASTLGGSAGADLDPLGDSHAARRDLGSRREGSDLGFPGTGLHDAHAGEDHRVSASSAHARPDVTEGPVNVPATDQGRPRDNVNADQDVAIEVQHLVQASYAGGAEGDGRGGSGGGGASGADGALGAGFHPQPLGLDDGEIYDLETSDPRLLPYFRQIHAKVEPYWQNAFPRSAIVDLKQGRVYLVVTVSRDGSAKVSWPPERPSGIDEFDRNCAEAIRRAMPFEPIPAALGVSTLRIRLKFVANNFVVK